MSSEKCYHCGLDCEQEIIHFDAKNFCCNGCKSVYELLNKHTFQTFYELNKNAGVKPETSQLSQFEYLDAESVFESIVDFSEGGTTLVSFKIPVIHCSSCVWLLESLQDLNPNIIYSQVNFVQKTVQISYKSSQMKLSEIAVFLTQLGYKPVINLESSKEHKKTDRIDSDLIVKLAIAGFAFGNVMLFTFPEYLDGKGYWLDQFKDFFRVIMFVLTLPVVLYSSVDYYKSAWAGLRNNRLNIDLPISLGIIVLFLRSCYEAYFDISNGYFDSLCGLLFFMLIGKYFQQRTYKALAFDRDYKSFYPIAVTRISFEGQENILLSDLKKGDRILIRNQEMIPADSIIIKGEAKIDNSFITGESQLVEKQVGDRIYAGGKQHGTILELEVIRDVNQSLLTQLWNKNAFHKKDSHLDTLINVISKYFTYIILGITLLGAIYWYFIDISKMFQVICAVLIVACPCALALSSPFTFGNMMRIFSRKNMYVKDAQTIEKMAKVTHIVFDKTGTITLGEKANIHFEGEALSEVEKSQLASIFKNSTHPLSQRIVPFLHADDEFVPLTQFDEIAGKGIHATIQGKIVQLGSANFVKAPTSETIETSVYVSIEGKLRGKFVFKNHYRTGIKSLFERLKNYGISLVSGDNASEKETIEREFPTIQQLYFNQSPEDKMLHIQKLQEKGYYVMMLGDGLNDAGALKQSNVGVAIAEDIHTFTPASDAILQGKEVVHLYDFLQLSKKAITIVTISFGISFAYNIVGLSFALSGNLSPLVAAILMPISSISVVSFTTLATWWIGRKK